MCVDPPKKNISDIKHKSYELPHVEVLLRPLQPRERLPGDIRPRHDLRPCELDLLVYRSGVDSNHFLRLLHHLVRITLLRIHVSSERRLCSCEMSHFKLTSKPTAKSGLFCAFLGLPGWSPRCWPSSTSSSTSSPPLWSKHRTNNARRPLATRWRSRTLDTLSGLALDSPSSSPSSFLVLSRL